MLRQAARMGPCGGAPQELRGAQQELRGAQQEQQRFEQRAEQQHCEPPPALVLALHCVSCGAKVSERGMQVRLLADTATTLFSTDSRPAGAVDLGDPVSLDDCICQLRDFACACGLRMGYHIERPCPSCAVDASHSWFLSDRCAHGSPLVSAAGEPLLWTSDGRGPPPPQPPVVEISLAAPAEPVAAPPQRECVLEEHRPPTPCQAHAAGPPMAAAGRPPPAQPRPAGEPDEGMARREALLASREGRLAAQEAEAFERAMEQIAREELLGGVATAQQEMEVRLREREERARAKEAELEARVAALHCQERAARSRAEAAPPAEARPTPAAEEPVRDPLLQTTWEVDRLKAEVASAKGRWERAKVDAESAWAEARRRHSGAAAPTPLPRLTPQPPDLGAPSPLPRPVPQAAAAERRSPAAGDKEAMARCARKVAEQRDALGQWEASLAARESALCTAEAQVRSARVALARARAAAGAAAGAAAMFTAAVAVAAARGVAWCAGLCGQAASSVLSLALPAEPEEWACPAPAEPRQYVARDGSGVPPPPVPVLVSGAPLRRGTGADAAAGGAPSAFAAPCGYAAAREPCPGYAAAREPCPFYCGPPQEPEKRRSLLGRASCSRRRSHVVGLQL